jgi:hypothetical protein
MAPQTTTTTTTTKSRSIRWNSFASAQQQVRPGAYHIRGIDGLSVDEDIIALQDIAVGEQSSLDLEMGEDPIAGIETVVAEAITHDELAEQLRGQIRSELQEEMQMQLQGRIVHAEAMRDDGAVSDDDGATPPVHHTTKAFCAGKRKFILVGVILMIVTGAVTGVLVFSKSGEDGPSPSQSPVITQAPSANPETTLAPAAAPTTDFIAAHSVSASQLQEHIDEWSGKQYHLLLVTGYEDTASTVYYNTIWHNNTENIDWLSYHGITESDYQNISNEKIAMGYRLIFIDGFSVTTTSGAVSPRINAIFLLQPTGPTWQVTIGLSAEAHHEQFLNYTANGYDLDIVSSYQGMNGNRRMASIWSRYTNYHAWYSYSGMTSGAYQLRNDDLVGTQGYSVQYVSAGTIEGRDPYFAALWVRDDEAPPHQAFHDVTDVQAKLDEWTQKGYVPKVIDAYLDAYGNVLWALLFEEAQQ